MIILRVAWSWSLAFSRILIGLSSVWGNSFMVSVCVAQCQDQCEAWEQCYRLLGNYVTKSVGRPYVSGMKNSRVPLIWPVPDVHTAIYLTVHTGPFKVMGALFTMKSLPYFISFLPNVTFLCLHHIKTLIARMSFEKSSHIDHHPGWRWLRFFLNICALVLASSSGPLELKIPGVWSCLKPARGQAFW